MNSPSSLFSNISATFVAALLLLTTNGGSLLSSSSLLMLVKADLVEYDFTFEQFLGGDDTLPLSSASPDCSNILSARRWLYAANGQYPGPTIEVTEGDTVRVTITNAVESTSLSVHWHGMYQMGTVYNDGVQTITQCALEPYGNQTYEFVAYPPGTHFYHSHVGMTTMDGIAGPLIVHSKTPEPFFSQYDEEQILFLSEFYDTTTSIQLKAGLINPQFEWIGKPNSLLLNGHGLSSACIGFNGTQPYANCVLEELGKGKDIHSGMDGCETTGDSITWPTCLDSCIDALKWTPSIMVKEGLTYRFRIINGGGLITQNLAIEDHIMTVVNVEMTNVVPFETTNLTIAPGQRYDVLVKADRPNSSITNYKMETTVMSRDIPKLIGRYILSYADSQDDVELPSKDYHSHPPLDTHMAYDDIEGQMLFMNALNTLNTSAHDTDIAALQANESEIDKYVITVQQGTHPNPKLTGLFWAMNNITFQYPSQNPLIYTAVTESQNLGWPLPDGVRLSGTIDLPHQIPNDTGFNFSLSMDAPGGPGYNIKEEGTTVVRLNQGDIAEFVFQNTIEKNGDNGEPHPYHLHGNDFWVVGRGYGDYNATRDVPNYNLENPVLRDTVVGLSGQWVALRLKANNPGVWFLHCHIEPHLAMGMGFVLIVSPDKIGSVAKNIQYCTGSSLQTNFQNEAINATVEALEDNSSEQGAFLYEGDESTTANVTTDSSLSPKIMCLDLWCMAFAIISSFMHIFFVY